METTNVFRKAAVLWRSKAQWHDIGKKAETIASLGVKHYVGEDGGNFHDNFTDINPTWAVRRHERAKESANRVITKL